MSAKITVCGRVHLGPVCVNGNGQDRHVCISCGEEVTQADRELVSRMYAQVQKMLAKHKDKTR